MIYCRSMARRSPPSHLFATHSPLVWTLLIAAALLIGGLVVQALLPDVTAYITTRIAGTTSVPGTDSFITRELQKVIFTEDNFRCYNGVGDRQYCENVFRPKQANSTSSVGYLLSKKNFPLATLTAAEQEMYAGLGACRITPNTFRVSIERIENCLTAEVPFMHVLGYVYRTAHEGAGKLLVRCTSANQGDDLLAVPKDSRLEGICADGFSRPVKLGFLAKPPQETSSPVPTSSASPIGSVAPSSSPQVSPSPSTPPPLTVALNEFAYGDNRRCYQHEGSYCREEFRHDERPAAVTLLGKMINPRAVTEPLTAAQQKRFAKITVCRIPPNTYCAYGDANCNCTSSRVRHHIGYLLQEASDPAAGKQLVECFRDGLAHDWSVVSQQTPLAEACDHGFSNPTRLGYLVRDEAALTTNTSTRPTFGALLRQWFTNLFGRLRQ